MGPCTDCHVQTCNCGPCYLVRAPSSTSSRQFLVRPTKKPHGQPHHFTVCVLLHIPCGSLLTAYLQLGFSPFLAAHDRDRRNLLLRQWRRQRVEVLKGRHEAPSRAASRAQIAAPADEKAPLTTAVLQQPTVSTSPRVPGQDAETVQVKATGGAAVAVASIETTNRRMEKRIRDPGHGSQTTTYKSSRIRGRALASQVTNLRQVYLAGPVRVNRIMNLCRILSNLLGQSPTLLQPRIVQLPAIGTNGISK